MSLGVSQSFSLRGAEGSIGVWGSWCPWAAMDAEWGEHFGGSSPKEGQFVGWDGMAGQPPAEITPQTVCEELSCPQKAWGCPGSFPWFCLDGAYPCQVNQFSLAPVTRRSGEGRQLKDDCAIPKAPPVLCHPTPTAAVPAPLR